MGSLYEQKVYELAFRLMKERKLEAKKARTSPLHLVTGLLHLKNSQDRKKENTTQAQFTCALGTSGLTVSPLGVGTNKWVYGQNDEQALQVFQSSLESGICFFDTADIYGFGKSERLLGECLRQNKRQAVIARLAWTCRRWISILSIFRWERLKP